MPELISEPTMIPVPGGKSIAEYIGRVKTGDNDVSVAVMHAPAGWSEPAQAPNFDEFTIVITGSIDVEHDGKTTTVGAGQALITRAGEKVEKGQKLFTLHTDEPARFESALEVLTHGYEIGAESEVSQRLPLIIDRVV